MKEFDVRLDGGRVLHAYDTGGDGDLAVFWHHGTPNLGTPPEPLLKGLRWVSYDRPSYGGSSPNPGRTIGSAAADTAAVADALGIGRFAVMGYSGGGSHALACAALLRERVAGVVTAAAIAPYGAEGLDWFTGMVPSGVASLTAAAKGREAKVAHEDSGVEYDPEFNERDWAALRGEWKWLGTVAGAGADGGRAGLIDDDLAYVSPWGCDPRGITAPILLLHGTADGIIPSSHGEWLAASCPAAQLRLMPGEGHISVLTGAKEALGWLRGNAHV
ncbi:MAG TPA: alpha/beta hydrolase [Candidatus Limnocylindrales bacterium]